MSERSDPIERTPALKARLRRQERVEDLIEAQHPDDPEEQLAPLVAAVVKIGREQGLGEILHRASRKLWKAAAEEGVL